MKLFNNNFISVLLILFVLVLAVNSVSATDNNITDINNVNSNLSNVLKSSSNLNDGDAISYDLMDNKDIISQKFSSNSIQMISQICLMWLILLNLLQNLLV